MQRKAKPKYAATGRVVEKKIKLARGGAAGAGAGMLPEIPSAGKVSSPSKKRGGRATASGSGYLTLVVSPALHFFGLTSPLSSLYTDAGSAEQTPTDVVIMRTALNVFINLVSNKANKDILLECKSSFRVTIAEDLVLEIRQSLTHLLTPHAGGLLDRILESEVYTSKDKRTRRPAGRIIVQLADNNAEGCGRHQDMVAKGVLPVLVHFLSSSDYDLRYDAVET